MSKNLSIKWLLATVVLFVSLENSTAQQFQPAASVNAPSAPAVERMTLSSKEEKASSAMSKALSEAEKSKRDRGANDEAYSLGIFVVKIPDTEKIAESRDAYAQTAWLNGVSSMITKMYSSVEAKVLFGVEGSSLADKFKSKKEALEKQIFAIQEKLKLAAFEVDQTVGLQVENQMKDTNNVDFMDRVNSMMDGVIKNIDKSYSVERIVQGKAEGKLQQAENLANVTAEAKKNLAALQGSLDALNSELKEEQRKTSATLTSDIERNASMPLFGVVPIKMAESYIGGVYEIAFVMKWSRSSERVARAVLLGQSIKDAPVPGRNVDAWLKSITPGTLTGSQAFTDENGDRWYVGVGAYPTMGGGMNTTLARENSSLNADRSLIFSLVANATSHQKAKDTLKINTNSKGISDQEYGRQFRKNNDRQ